ncbi:MAG: methylated-DNA--[protein]-cysteine S-methyltransferase [Gammaproteobacteria bacterium WSBS_2016_MAG_OTU1]
MRWDLKLKTPLGIFAVQCDDYAIIAAAYLSSRFTVLPPQNPLAKEAARQVHAYFKRAHGFVFELPLLSAPSEHQRRVRTAMQNIPFGETCTYGEIAKHIKSSARAVGGACRANRLPLFVPCHRVVAANGLGGFMGEGGHEHHIKKFLLQHEQTNLSHH